MTGTRYFRCAQNFRCIRVGKIDVGNDRPGGKVVGPSTPKRQNQMTARPTSKRHLTTSAAVEARLQQAKQRASAVTRRLDEVELRLAQLDRIADCIEQAAPVPIHSAIIVRQAHKA